MKDGLLEDPFADVHSSQRWRLHPLFTLSPFFHTHTLTKQFTWPQIHFQVSVFGLIPKECFPLSLTLVLASLAVQYLREEGNEIPPSGDPVEKTELAISKEKVWLRFSLPPTPYFSLQSSRLSTDNF